MLWLRFRRQALTIHPFDLDRDLLLCKSNILILNPSRFDELLPSLPLSIPPASETKILVEHYNRPLPKSPANKLQEGPRGLVGIRIDMNEREVLWMVGQEIWHGFIEPSLYELHVPCGLWQPPAKRKVSDFQDMSLPILPEPFKGVEAIDPGIHSQLPCEIVD